MIFLDMISFIWRERTNFNTGDRETRGRQGDGSIVLAILRGINQQIIFNDEEDQEKL